jgi:hypothetical protein
MMTPTIEQQCVTVDAYRAKKADPAVRVEYLSRGNVWQPLYADIDTFVSRSPWLPLRLAPTPTLRPYTDAELFENLAGKYLISKASESKRLVTDFLGDGVRFRDGAEWDAKEILDQYTHIDGSPCGVTE